MAYWIAATACCAALSACAAAPIGSMPTAVADTPATTSLEQQTRAALNGTELERRRAVDRIFDLARRYAEEDRPADAARLYRQGLEVEAANLPMQLELAALLERAGETTGARDRALQVYELAEDASLIDSAAALLRGLGAAPVAAGDIVPPEVDGIELVLVPLGNPHPVLLEGLRAELQRRTGIRNSIADRPLSLGNPDRTHAEPFLARAYEATKASMTREQVEALLAELGMQAVRLANPEEQVRFLSAVLAKYPSPGQPTPADFNARVEVLKREPQYDVGRLLVSLRMAYRLKPGDRTKGYIAVTDADLYSPDANYLFAGNDPRYAVLSYYRFLAVNNGQHQNRARLLNRMAKQGLSSSFTVLGMRRCSNVRCVTNFPMSVAELDEKSAEPCTEHAAHLSHYKAAAKADPGASMEQYRAAMDLQRAGRQADAIAALQIAVAQEPNFFPAHYGLAMLYLEQGRREEALAELTLTTEIEPFMAEAWRAQGATLGQLGRLGESAAIFSRALELWPSDADLHNDLGYTLYLGKQYREAIDALERAIALKPEDGLAHYNLALARHATGNRGGALTALERAEDLGYRGDAAFRRELEEQKTL